MDRLRIEGDWFLDGHGRRILLRGVNLGGDCKVPWPDGGTDHPTDFSDHREVSFVNRPFPLDEAAEHLGRIRHWGFDCLRLLTTWEAIEHAGPGQHDEAYLDYLAEVCRLAGEHGLYLFVDLHQDTFSRMTGGDGAPGWVLEAVGLDLEQIDATDAAVVMQHRYDYDDPRPEQPDNYPRMCWSQNYQLAANGILWTLFFAGDDLCPELEIDGRGVQDFLQGHYLGAMLAVARRVAHLDHVLGFGSLNEPSSGWVGLAMTDRGTADRLDRPARPGPAVSPLDALYCAAGHPVRVPWLEPRLLQGGCVPVREITLNPGGKRLWRDGFQDPFAEAWEVVDGQPRAVREDALQRVDGRELDFDADCLCPFVERVAEGVRSVREDWLVFAEKDAFHAVTTPRFGGELPPGTVNATHWYDLVVLERKRPMSWVNVDIQTRRPVFGRAGIRRMYTRQLGRIREAGREINAPSLIGEFGIPYDLGERAALRAWAAGDRSARPWRHHVRLLEDAYDTLDALLLHGTQWNYTASNRNDPRVGDGWNQEDLSIFSRDQQDDPADPDSGGRALAGLVRPYALATQGVPTQMSFDRRRGVFRLEYEADPSIEAPTEVYVPKLQFPAGWTAVVDGRAEEDPEGQRLRVWADRAGRHTLVVRRR